MQGMLIPMYRLAFSIHLRSIPKPPTNPRGVCWEPLRGPLGEVPWEMCQSNWKCLSEVPGGPALPEPQCWPCKAFNFSPQGPIVKAFHRSPCKMVQRCFTAYFGGIYSNIWRPTQRTCASLLISLDCTVNDSVVAEKL